MDRFRLAGIYSVLSKNLADREDLYLVGSVEEQRLFLCEADRVIETYPASTSRLGGGIREDYIKTPPGFTASARRSVRRTPGASSGPQGYRNRLGRVSREDNLILTASSVLRALRGINRAPAWTP